MSYSSLGDSQVSVCPDGYAYSEITKRCECEPSEDDIVADQNTITGFRSTRCLRAVFSPKTEEACKKAGGLWEPFSKVENWYFCKPPVHLRNGYDQNYEIRECVKSGGSWDRGKCGSRKLKLETKGESGSVVVSSAPLVLIGCVSVLAVLLFMPGGKR